MFRDDLKRLVQWLACNPKLSFLGFLDYSQLFDSLAFGNHGFSQWLKKYVWLDFSLNNLWAGKTFLHHTVVQKAKGSRQYAKRRYEKFVIKFPHRLRLYRLHLYLHDDLIFLQFEERNERPNESYDHRCYKSFRFHMHRVLSFSFPLYFPLSP